MTPALGKPARFGRGWHTLAQPANQLAQIISQECCDKEGDVAPFMVQNWLTNLVSEFGMVQWLGRCREGVSRYGSDPLSKKRVELKPSNQTY
eukprot:29002-Pelagomonas_calceolata.AAC.1